MKLNSAATFISGCLLLAGLHFECSDAFVSPFATKSKRDESVAFRQRTTKRYNFFKNMLEQAFENDGNLSKDVSKGQYDAPGDEFKDIRPASQLTETQKRWREKQNTNDVTPAMIESKAWKVDLYLSGVPERDPSNDLYASKVNISSRDKATGLSIPEEPSTSTTIEFLENGVCRAVASDFTSGDKDGAWKLSEDGKMLRFSFDSTGYTRNVQTKGSIQKIYWSKDEQVTRQTMSTYSIPPGWVYGDIVVKPGRQPGTLDVSEDGVLRIEQKQGLMGASSKMVPCGKFRARTSSD